MTLSCFSHLSLSLSWFSSFCLSFSTHQFNTGIIFMLLYASLPFGIYFVSLYLPFYSSYYILRSYLLFPPFSPFSFVCFEEREKTLINFFVLSQLYYFSFVSFQLFLTSKVLRGNIFFFLYVCFYSEMCDMCFVPELDWSSLGIEINRGFSYFPYILGKFRIELNAKIIRSGKV